MKLTINNNHNSQDIINIRLSLLKKRAKRMNVIVPKAVRMKLMYVGLTSCSTLRKITLDPTNVSTAKIARSSPDIEIEKALEHKLFCIINPFPIKIKDIITSLRKKSLLFVEENQQIFSLIPFS